MEKHASVKNNTILNVLLRSIKASNKKHSKDTGARAHTHVLEIVMLSQ